MGRDNPDAKRKAAPVSNAVFLRPNHAGYGREGDGYKTRKGKKSAWLCTGYQPPDRLSGSAW